MFHWICPECGREIPPAARDCPVCDSISGAPADATGLELAAAANENERPAIAPASIDAASNSELNVPEPIAGEVNTQALPGTATTVEAAAFPPPSSAVASENRREEAEPPLAGRISFDPLRAGKVRAQQPHPGIQVPAIAFHPGDDLNRLLQLADSYREEPAELVDAEWIDESITGRVEDPELVDAEWAHSESPLEAAKAQRASGFETALILAPKAQLVRGRNLSSNGSRKALANDVNNDSVNDEDAGRRSTKQKSQRQRFSARVTPPMVPPLMRKLESQLRPALESISEPKALLTARQEPDPPMAAALALPAIQLRATAPKGPEHSAEPVTGQTPLLRPYNAFFKAELSYGAWQRYSPLAQGKVRAANPLFHVMHLDPGPRFTLPGPMLSPRLRKFQDRELAPQFGRSPLSRPSFRKVMLGVTIAAGMLLGAGFSNVLFVTSGQRPQRRAV